MGLVDAVSGVRASQARGDRDDQTTPDVITKTYSSTFNPKIPTDYIVHFALQMPDGTYLAGDDTDVFTYSG
jgi:hypothetical protein